MMKHHPKREGSPIAQDVPMCPMSPNSRRRAEFTIKQLQSGMMCRARSTLSTLGDVWRPKSTVSTKPTDTTNHKGTSTKTLEFLTLWATRPKKVASDENAVVTSTRDKSLTRSPTSRKPVLVDTSNKKFTILTNPPVSNGKTHHHHHHHHQANGEHLRSRRRRHNTISQANESTMMTKSMSSVSQSAKRYSRHNSLDLNEILGDRCRVDDLVFSNGRPSAWPGNVSKVRRNSCIEQIPDDSVRNDDVDSRIIKARLKLQKVASFDGGSTEHTTTATTQKPGILHRPSSVEPGSNPDARGSDETIGPDGYSLQVLPQRPRKKLSFREPVENDSRPMAIQSDTLPRARRFLERYERTMQTQNVELEVRLV